MATSEKLLKLDHEGWKQIAAMTDEQLEEYLKDVTTLEPKAKQINIVPKEPDDNEIEPDKPLKTKGTALDELKEDAADSDSPFAKRKKPKKKKGFILDDENDPEFLQLKKDLGFE